MFGLIRPDPIPRRLPHSLHETTGAMFRWVPRCGFMTNDKKTRQFQQCRQTTSRGTHPIQTNEKGRVEKVSGRRGDAFLVS